MHIPIWLKISIERLQWTHIMTLPCIILNRFYLRRNSWDCISIQNMNIRKYLNKEPVHTILNYIFIIHIIIYHTDIVKIKKIEPGILYIIFKIKFMFIFSFKLWEFSDKQLKNYNSNFSNTIFSILWNCLCKQIRNSVLDSIFRNQTHCLT